ncbi:hypothetical protein ACSBR2_012704 [Camellia fascicularis]
MQTSVGILSLIGFLTIAAIDFSFCNGNHDVVVMCREGEKQTLLQFKKDLEDPTNGLSSWEVEDDCCKWEGVVCDNFTGQVLELNLRNSYTDGIVDGVSQRYDKFRLNGKINPCLQKLKHLKYLDLSENDFTNIPFPPVIASMTQLQYINLSNAGFVGTIPHQLGNLSSLRSLSLQSIMNVENLQWLSGLSRLEHLDLSGVNLVKVPNWLLVINNLPFLVELRLVGCELDHFPPFLSAINFTSLAVLDLSANQFGSLIPGWIFNLGSLVYLRLSSCHLIGPIPQGSWNLTSLETLDVSYSQNLNSSLPNSLFSTTNSLVYLSLTNCGFQGPFPTIVPNMTNLSYLDLSYNSLNSTIPSWLYSFSRLEVLNLGSNRLEGRLPNSIGNLAYLSSLDLSYNLLEGRLPNSIGNLASLYSLDLSYNGLEGRLPNSIGNLASLEILQLSYNGLEESLPGSLGNLCNLRHIGLSHNKFSGELCTSSSKCIAIHALEDMLLDGNKLSGHIPDQIGQFQNLTFILLSGNLLSGPIPETLGRLTSLRTLSLEDNKLNGTLPQSLGQLSKLLELHVSNNLLEGTVSEVHFTNLANLRQFHASGNRLTLKVSPDWIPPFQLLEIELRSWHLGPEFPIWLQSQKQLDIIDLSCTGITDRIPTWFWNLSSSTTYLNLSHNQLHSEISYIPGDVGRVFLSSNNLNGEISDCWMAGPLMTVIDMGNNNLKGNIPSSMQYLGGLQSLHLRNNHLSGEISSSLQNCNNLVMFDLCENKFIGSIPTWMGERLLHLTVLILRSNKLDGMIPLELCRISSLQILDLANNNLSGAIPWCINNITSMAMKRNSGVDLTYRVTCSSKRLGCWSSAYLDNANLVTKGSNYQYDKILALVTIIDVSNNNLYGSIPEELTGLLGLLSLNLSRNHLIGVIPKKMGDMVSLESLDLSKNQIRGEIPPSMSGLTFLSYLNLSYNNLSGKIPLSTQLQSFNASSFLGNKLCGLPLTKNCSVDGEKPNVGNEGSEVDWFYLSMAFGFAVGFWGISIPTLFIKSWRYVYFRFLDNVWTRLYVYIQVNMIRF